MLIAAGIGAGFVIMALAVVLALLATVLIPAHLLPGIEGGVEYHEDTVVISDAAKQATIDFEFDHTFAVPPNVVCSGQITLNSGGSATTYIDNVDIAFQSRTTTGVSVLITLDVAPGAGESCTVEAYIQVMGKVPK